MRPDKVESTPLMDAANVGYSDIVQVLLEYGANSDLKSSTNNTALHYAACSGHSRCCRLILDYSTNRQALLEEQNENGHTALMEASTSGFLETTKFFVKNGAQINTPSAEFKETALTLASYKVGLGFSFSDCPTLNNYHGNGYLFIIRISIDWGRSHGCVGIVDC